MEKEVSHSGMWNRADDGVGTLLQSNCSEAYTPNVFWHEMRSTEQGHRGKRRW